MAKPELGTKRTCPNCGKKYYDLNRDPITCPSCDTVFVVAPVRITPTKAEEKKPAEVDETEAAVEPIEEKAELVSLEEADVETADTGAVAIEADDDDTVEGEEDNTFLESDDEESDDVTGIIGTVSDEEER
ncbi:MAG: TIGR02300 family protein [Hyphomicrobiales bacterium]|nr:TIGR02300 family protein [Hyphomicrobiales bacterium]